MFSISSKSPGHLLLRRPSTILTVRSNRVVVDCIDCGVQGHFRLMGRVKVGLYRNLDMNHIWLIPGMIFSQTVTLSGILSLTQRPKILLRCCKLKLS